MSNVFVYVVDRDFGFAPNPFHGSCTLAACKPVIRRRAVPGDWVIGMGGSRLKATGRCIFAMRISKKLSFNEYWKTPEFRDKKPVRNGSMKMLVGDNIYYRDPSNGQWHQADSHHSNADGSANQDNLKRDTGVDAVLISTHFYYFGKSAPEIPARLLRELGYKNVRSHRVFDLNDGGNKLVSWIESEFPSAFNQVSADPFDFARSAARYSGTTNKISD